MADDPQGILAQNLGQMGLPRRRNQNTAMMKGDKGDKGDIGNTGNPGLRGDDTIRYSKRLSTPATGIIDITLPEANLNLLISPLTANAQLNSIAWQSSTVARVTFKKTKAALGLTLGTLLTASVFEDATGVVQFDVLGVATI